jgi:hypothetical protein
MVSLTLPVSGARSPVRAHVPIVEGWFPMSDRTLTLDLSDLAVESVEVIPADSLDSATYGHGMTELSASCVSVFIFSNVGSCFMPDDSEDE